MSFLSKLSVLLNSEPEKSERRKAESAGSIGISITFQSSEPRPRSTPSSTLRQLAEPSRDILLGEFSIVDIETTGLSPEQDTIIEIAAINVGPGFQIAAEFSTLVKTDAWIPHQIVELTGLTQADVNSRGIPLANAMAAFVGHVSNRPVFAHNAHFDFSFLARAANLCGVTFDNKMHDSIRIAHEAWPGLPSYKLSVLAEQFELPHTPTHRALDDVKATLALLRAAHETFSGVRPWNAPVHSSTPPVHHSIARLGDTKGPLHGESVVFTGELSLTREHAADMAAQAGCAVTPSVTKKTTLLVVGTQDLATLAGHDKSSKQRKAEELIAEGQRIRIITEADFLALVNS